MNAADTIATLNELLAVHSRSLAVYLSDAVPWLAAGGSHAWEAIERIAGDHQATYDRIGDLILQKGGDVDSGEFPMAFTGYNDLSLDFLLQKLIEGQTRDIKRIEACVARLGHDAHARAVAQEALGAAIAHQETLQDLALPGKQVG